MNKPPQPTRVANNENVARHLANQGSNPQVANYLAFKNELGNWFKTNAKTLRSLTGNDEDAAALMASLLSSISRTPSLLECTKESIFACLLRSAEFRLFPGALGECAYVPFNNSKIGKKEATFILQYQGVCQLLYRSGMVKDIEAGVVCSNDYFEFKRGSERALIFEPFDGSLEERGDWLGAYCIIRNIFGGQHIAYMTAKDVLQIKSRSRASASKESPWNSEHASDRAWMWMKTVLKQCSKLAPKNRKLSSGLLADAEQDEDLSANTNAIDVRGVADGLGFGVHPGYAAELDAPRTAFEMPSSGAEKEPVNMSNAGVAHGVETRN